MEYLVIIALFLVVLCSNMPSDRACLAAVITTLTGAVSNMTPASAFPVQPIVLDPFTGENPFDLSTRSGSVAYELLSKSLDDPMK